MKFDIRELHMVRIQSMLEKGEHVDGDLLATALRDDGDKPIPPDVLEYLCRFIEGKEKMPRGPKKIPEGYVRQNTTILSHFYARYLQWLKARKKRYGQLDGWPSIREADFWQGPPHEIAARMVARKFRNGAESWRTIHNRNSSQK